MRVVLDSNVWLAVLTTNGFCRRVWRAARNQSRFIVSQEILDEVAEKLRAKFGFSPRHAGLMTYFVRQQAEFGSAVSKIAACRDADDNLILAAALDSKCSHLITGDSDLLDLKHFQDVSIITPREFFELISKT